MRTHNYTVYILANARPTLYVGVTGDLVRRLREHRRGERPEGWASRFHVGKLVHVEHFDRIEEAIAREKEIKSMSRGRKLELIRARNPELRDLSPPARERLPPERRAPAPWELRRFRG